jgi:hypothetical protein
MGYPVTCDQEKDNSELRYEWTDSCQYCEACISDNNYSICNKCYGVIPETGEDFCESCEEFVSEPEWKREDPDWDDSNDPD